MSTDVAGRADVKKKITSGRLLGYAENGIDTFLGVPCAEVPLGDRVFCQRLRGHLERLGIRDAVHSPDRGA